VARSTGEDEVAPSVCAWTGHQVGPEPALDSGVLDENRDHVAGVDLARRGVDAAAAHDHQAEQVSGRARHIAGRGPGARTTRLSPRTTASQRR
jgi:hypothetical protein